MTRFLDWFTEAKKIYGICPCCGELFRLSEVPVFTKSPPPKTEFDHVEERQRRLEARKNRFEERETEIRESAKLRGQQRARRRLRRISPYFFGKAINPQDVKLLFDPVRYIVFRGLTKNKCSLIEFVDHPPETKAREKIQNSLSRSIQAGNMEWQTFRVEPTGRILRDPARRDL